MNTMLNETTAFPEKNEPLIAIDDSARSNHKEQNHPAIAPVARAERISTIDVLRGVAVLGILLMNIAGFALPHQAYEDPTVAGGATGWNLGIWFFNFVLIDGKMRAIFSMLFGAGVILLTSRAEERGGASSVADIYYRRNLWLLAFGVVDAFVLLWPGDILYAYALCGLFLYPLRKLSPRVLLIAGSLMLAVLIPKTIFKGYELQDMKIAAAKADSLASTGATLTEEQLDAQKAWADELKDSKPDSAAIQKQIDKRRSDYWTIFTAFIPINASLQSKSFYKWDIWDCGGMMLLGMALMKLGVFSATRSRRIYALMAIIGYGVGVPLNAFIAYDNVANNFEPVRTMLNYSTYDIGRVAVALGHVGLIMSICRAGILKRVTSWLASVGQMALTNYVMQTVICTLLFYGYGFGLFGKLERYQLYGVVAAIWIFQLVISPLWLRYFRFGPLEWVWRSLTYWQRQPMRNKVLEHVKSDLHPTMV